MEVRKNYVIEVTKDEQKAFALVANRLRNLSDEDRCFDDIESMTEILFSIGDKDSFVPLSNFYERIDFSYRD